MDLLDRLALSARRYEKRHSAVTGSTKLSLEEVLRVFKDKTIFELELPDQARGRVAHEVGRPVSILDGIAAINSDGVEGYEVLQTSPSGDYSRVKITALPTGGQLSCLIGRRVPEHSVAEDPLLDVLRTQG